MTYLQIMSVALMMLSTSVVADELPDVSDDHYHLRGSLTNSKFVFESTKRGHVAFIGGSITEMNGYRPLMSAYLKQQFPATQFIFTDAGIASTCSMTGAFRMQRDVLSKGPVDLLFIEFAVNDDQDAGFDFAHAVRGMEGMIAHVRRHNPQADIIVTHFANPGMMDRLRQGEIPVSMAAHNAVCKHHRISTNDLCSEITQLIDTKKTTWALFGGVHPKPYGNAICHSMLVKLLQQGWKKPVTRVTAHFQAASLLDAKSYVNGYFISPQIAERGTDWRFSEPAWKEIKGGFRNRFGGASLLHGQKPGSEFRFTFEGTFMGAFVLAGPDAGVVEVQVDGGSWRSVNFYHRHSRGLHYPRTVVFAEDLKAGSHVLTVRISKATDAQSQGRAIRIMEFAVNGPQAKD
jgi:lysophospholipase L1-like esterase